MAEPLARRRPPAAPLFDLHALRRARPPAAAAASCSLAVDHAAYATLERAQAGALLSGPAELLSTADAVHAPTLRCSAGATAPGGAAAACECRFNPFLALNLAQSSAGGASDSAGAPASSGRPAAWQPVWLVLTCSALLLFAPDSGGGGGGGGEPPTGAPRPWVLQHALALDGEAAACAVGAREWQWFTGWDRATTGWRRAAAQWGASAAASPLLVYTLRAASQSDMTAWLAGVACATAGPVGGDVAPPPLLSDNQMLALPDAWGMTDAAAACDRDAALLLRLAVGCDASSPGGPTQPQPPPPADPSASLSSSRRTASIDGSGPGRPPGSPAHPLPAGSPAMALLQASAVRDALQRLAVSRGRGEEALLTFWAHVRAFELAHPLSALLCPQLAGGSGAPAPQPQQQQPPPPLRITRGSPVEVPEALAPSLGASAADAASCGSQARALLARFLTADPLDALLSPSPAAADSGGSHSLFAGDAGGGSVRLSAAGIILGHVPAAALAHLHSELAAPGTAPTDLLLPAAPAKPLLAAAPPLGGSGAPLRIAHGALARQQLRPAAAGPVPAPALASASSVGASVSIAASPPVRTLRFPPPDCFAAARTAVEHVIARALLQPLAVQLALRTTRWMGGPEEPTAARGAGSGEAAPGGSGGGSDSAREATDRAGGLAGYLLRRLSVAPPSSAARSRGASTAVAPSAAGAAGGAALSRSRTMATPAGGPLGPSRRATVSLRPPTDRGRLETQAAASAGGSAAANSSRRPSLSLRGSSVGAVVGGSSSGGGGNARRAVSFFDAAGSAAATDLASSDFAATSAAASLMPLSLVEQAAARGGSFSARGSVSLGARRFSLVPGRRDSSASGGSDAVRRGDGASFAASQYRARGRSGSLHRPSFSESFAGGAPELADDELFDQLGAPPLLPLYAPATSMWAELANACLREEAAAGAAGLAGDRAYPGGGGTSPASGGGPPSASAEDARAPPPPSPPVLLPTAALSLLCALAPALVTAWQHKWERVRRSSKAAPGPRSGGGAAAIETPPPVHTCALPAAPGGVAVDRSVLVLLMHKYRVPVRGVVPFMELVIRAAVPDTVALPMTPDGRAIGSPRDTPPSRANAAGASGVGGEEAPPPGSWASIWLPGASPSSSSAAAASTASLDAPPSELEGSNASMQDAAATALLISHELAQLARDAGDDAGHGGYPLAASSPPPPPPPAAASLAHAAATAAAPWRHVTAADLTLRPSEAEPPLLGSVALPPPTLALPRRGSSTALQQQLLPDDASSAPATPPVSSRSRSGSGAASFAASVAREPALAGGSAAAATVAAPAPSGAASPHRAAAATVGMSPAALSHAQPSAQPAWLGVFPTVPRGLLRPLSSAAPHAAAVAVAAAAAATVEPAALDRGSRVARLAAGGGGSALPPPAPAVALPLPPHLPLPPACTALVRVLWTPVLTSLGADPRGRVHVLDDARPRAPFTRCLVVEHAPSAAVVSRADVDFSGAAAALLRALLAHAGASPLLLRASLTGPVLSFMRADEPSGAARDAGGLLPAAHGVTSVARLQQLLALAARAAPPLAGAPAAAAAPAALPAALCDGIVGALHLGSPELLDVTPARDAQAPGHALELLLPTGHLTLVPAAPACAARLLEALRRAALHAKRGCGGGAAAAAASHSADVLCEAAGGLRLLWAPPPLGAPSAAGGGAIGTGSRASLSLARAGGDASSLADLYARIAAAAGAGAAAAAPPPAGGDPAATAVRHRVLALCVEVEKRGQLNRDYKRRLLRVLLHAAAAPGGSGGGAPVEGELLLAGGGGGVGSPSPSLSRRSDRTGSGLPSSALAPGRLEAATLLAAAASEPPATPPRPTAAATAAAAGGSQPALHSPAPPSSAGAWPHRWMVAQPPAATAPATASAASGACVVTRAARLRARAAWAPVLARHVALSWADGLLLTGPGSGGGGSAGAGGGGGGAGAYAASAAGGAKAQPLAALIATAHGGRLPRGACTPLPFLALAHGSGDAAVGRWPGAGLALASVAAQVDYHKPASGGFAGGGGGGGSAGPRPLGGLRGSIQLLGAPWEAAAASSAGGSRAPAAEPLSPSVASGPAGSAAAPTAGAADGASASASARSREAAASAAASSSSSHVTGLTAVLLDADPLVLQAAGSGSGSGSGGGGGGLLSRGWWGRLSKGSSSSSSRKADSGAAAAGGEPAAGRGAPPPPPSQPAASAAAADGVGESSDWGAVKVAATARKRSGSSGTGAGAGALRPRAPSSSASSGEGGGDEAGSGGGQQPQQPQQQQQLTLQPLVALRLATRERTWELRVAQPHDAAALAALLRVCGPARHGDLPALLRGSADGGGGAPGGAGDAGGAAASGDDGAFSVCI